LCFSLLRPCSSTHIYCHLQIIMSEITASEYFDSVPSNPGTAAVAGAKVAATASSKAAVIELVGLWRLTRQSVVPGPVPESVISPPPVSEAPAFVLVPTKLVLFEPPVASTDKSVCKMTCQTSKSVDHLTGKQTPT
jgi:hypothetical protein